MITRETQQALENLIVDVICKKFKVKKSTAQRVVEEAHQRLYGELYRQKKKKKKELVRE